MIETFSIAHKDVMSFHITAEDEGVIIINPGWHELGSILQMDVMQDFKADFETISSEVRADFESEFSSVSSSDDDVFSGTQKDIMTAYFAGEDEGSLLTNPGWDELPPGTQLSVIQDLRGDLDRLYLEISSAEEEKISKITGAQLQHWRDEKKALEDAKTPDPSESDEERD